MKKTFILFILLALVKNSYAQFACGDTLFDSRDGQKYPTVLIGNDCWFKKNLNYGTMVMSDSLGIIHSQQSNNGIPEKYAQQNNANNLSIYGGLYEQQELMNYSPSPQGLCPNGWHVSTDQEWQNLITYAGANMSTANAGNGSNGLKALGTGIGMGAGTNTSGISLLPGGDRDGFGIFYGKELRYIYWTSTTSGTNQAWHYMLWAEKDTIERLSLGTVTTGFSCRCVKDLATGLNEMEEIDFNIYPNPSENQLQINSTKSFNEIEIFDSFGGIIYTQSFQPINSLILQTTNWPRGIYFLSIVGLDNVRTTKKISIIR
jgi:uncharacterized protein (TIGR02145 family)